MDILQKKQAFAIIFLVLILSISVRAQNVQYADTAAMLSSRLKISDTASMLAARPLNNRFLDSIAIIRALANTKGTVFGTGATGQITYWNGTSTQTGSSNLFWNSVSNYLTIGNSSGTNPFGVWVSGKERTGLTTLGHQYWLMNSGISEIGGIGYTTPGGNPAVTTFKTGVRNRFDLGLNYEDYTAFGYDSLIATPSIAFFRAGRRVGFNTITDNGTDIGQFNGSIIATAIKKSGGTSSQYLMADGSVSTLTNPITGIGASGQISYFTGTNTQAGSNNLFWDNTNGRLGLGTSTPSYPFEYKNGATIRTVITTLGSQFWYVNSGSAEAGTIAFGTPGGDAGIFVLRPNGNSRFNGMVNAPNYTYFGYDSLASPAITIFRSGHRIGFSTTTDNGTDIAQFNGSISATTPAGSSVAAILTKNTTGVGQFQYRTPTQILSDIGAAASIGSANYIQNSTSQQASSNFSISDTGRAARFVGQFKYNPSSLNYPTIVGTTNAVNIWGASAIPIAIDLTAVNQTGRINFRRFNPAGTLGQSHVMAAIQGFGYDGVDSAGSLGTSIQFLGGATTGVWSGTSHPSEMLIRTVDSGATAQSERFRIKPNGDILINGATQDFISKLRVTGGIRASGNAIIEGTGLIGTSVNNGVDKLQVSGSARISSTVNIDGNTFLNSALTVTNAAQFNNNVGTSGTNTVNGAFYAKSSFLLDGSLGSGVNELAKINAGNSSLNSVALRVVNTSEIGTIQGTLTTIGGYFQGVSSTSNTAKDIFLQPFGANTLLGASSYFNWGTTSGTSGYGFRDNAGTMEYKNSSGSWAAFGSSLNGTGATGQITYWNGTNSQTGSTNLFWDNTSQSLGIGTSSPTDKLTVNGNIRAKKLTIVQVGWSDYVFYKDYKLRSLNDVEDYIKKYQHLPDVPSAKEVEEKGISVGDTQAILLRKIEELTLYMIDMKKENGEQKREIELLKKKIK